MYSRDRFTNLSVFISSELLLILAWIVGNLSGVLISVSYLLPQFPSMYISACGNVSSVRVFIASIFPLFLCYLAVHCSARFLLYPIIFIKAFAFSICFCCSCSEQGSAAWLLRCVLFAADLVCIIAMLWFSLRHISDRRTKQTFEFCLLSYGVLLICLIDHYYISPIIALFA